MKLAPKNETIRCCGADLPLHTNKCSCGKEATVHIAGGFTCENVCQPCAKRFLKRRTGAQVKELVN